MYAYVLLVLYQTVWKLFGLGGYVTSNPVAEDRNNGGMRQLTLSKSFMT